MADVLGTEKTARASQSIKEIDILWITTGLGCDGDSVAMTAATQPSLEDEARFRREIQLGDVSPVVRRHGSSGP